jgi:hypothetical protein
LANALETTDVLISGCGELCIFKIGQEWIRSSLSPFFSFCKRKRGAINRETYNDYVLEHWFVKHAL